MSKRIRSALILVLATVVAVAHSPATFADKKGNSNSSNSDDKQDKIKDKDKDKDDQNNQRQGRSRQKNDDDKKISNAVQQFQKSQSGGSEKQRSLNKQQTISEIQKSSSDKQGSPQNTPPLIIGSPQSGQIQKLPQQPFIQKQQGQNNPKQNNQQPVFQQPSKKDKWQYQSHKDHKELHKWVDNFGGPKPFSSKWYKDHPKAWHHNHHDHDDWKFVTAAGLVGFLGWQTYHSQGPVVVYEPLTYDTLFVSRPGVVIDPNRGEWMPLGVYSLMVGPGDINTRMLDLTVDRFGHIRGAYYDMISGASYNVAGVIDRRTQYAQWSLESNRQLTFFTPVGEMMQPQGYVEVRLPSGQRQQWQLVRMETGS